MHTEAGTGALVYRLSNVDTGATMIGDASASSIMIHHSDGGLTYVNHGPLLVGFREGRGNVPRGFYEIDGPAWSIHISADNYRTVSGAYRIAKNICETLG